MAAFENKTTQEVRELIINSIQAKFNTTFRMLPKSFVRVIATVFAGVYIVLYKQIGWIFLQLFPETAYWGTVSAIGTQVRPLVKWGNLIGAGDPKAGTTWKGCAAVKVTTKSGVLAPGTQLQSEVTGKLYITKQSVPLDSSVVQAPVICTESGTAGNLDLGDNLSFVNPLGNVEKVATVSAIESAGADAETEGEYRKRVVSRFRNKPTGGSLSDYRAWASDVAGVLNVYPYKDTATAAGVLLYVSAVPDIYKDRIPSRALLVAAGLACTYDPVTGAQNRKPMTAVLDPTADESFANVMPVCVLFFDIEVTGMKGIPVADFAAAAKGAVEDYFLGREPYIRGLSDDNNKTNIVSRNNVLSVIDQCAIGVKAEFENVIMKLEGTAVSSYELGRGELSALGVLTVNGVKA